MAFMDDYVNSVSGGASTVTGAIPKASGAASALGGLASGIGGLMTGGLLPLASSVLGGIMGGPDTPSTAISGGGTFNAGGINVGSKVVGSGSAATSFPSQANSGGQGGGGFMTDNSATAGAALPKWAIPAAIGAVVLVVLFLVIPKRKK